MKHKWYSFLCALFLCTALSAPNQFSVQAAESFGSFYKEAARLINENWGNYTATLQFVIGSADMLAGQTSKPIDTDKSIVPLLIEGRVFLPVRVIVEEGGGTIRYQDNGIDIIDSGNQIHLEIGNAAMTVNGKRISLDAPPVIIGQRTFVPLRAITESLGYRAAWEERQKTVILSKDFQTMRLLVKAKNETFDPWDYGAAKVIEGPDYIYILQFKTVKDAKECYNLIINLGQIEYAEPDRYIPPVIETPRTSVQEENQTSLDWGAKRIGAGAYAENLKGNNSGVTVAVIDTGVDMSHPFLQGRLLTNGYNFVSDSENVMDDHFHGTHVAGIIVACTEGLNINILPIKALNQDGSGTAILVAAGIQYAVEQKADIINLSLREPSLGVSHYLDSVINEAIAANTVVVAAAGNDKSNTGFFCPAHNDKAIVVGAADKNDKIADFSNYGASVDAAAPGVSIVSSIPGGKFASLSGTSMASPHVAAIAAMMKLQDASLTPGEIEENIKMISQDKGPLGWDPYYGAGIPNLLQRPQNIAQIANAQNAALQEMNQISAAQEAASMPPEPSAETPRIDKPETPAETPPPESSPAGQTIPLQPSQTGTEQGKDYNIASLRCSIVKDNTVKFVLQTKEEARNILMYFNGSTVGNPMTKESSMTWTYEFPAAQKGNTVLQIQVFDMTGGSSTAAALLQVY